MSQWWSLAPAVACFAGSYAFNKNDVLGWFLLCLSGLGWFVYGVMTNQVGLWIFGVVLACYFYTQVQVLVWHRPPGTLGEEDNIQRQE